MLDVAWFPINVTYMVVFD